MGEVSCAEFCSLLFPAVFPEARIVLVSLSEGGYKSVPDAALAKRVDGRAGMVTPPHVFWHGRFGKRYLMYLCGFCVDVDGIDGGCFDEVIDEVRAPPPSLVAISSERGRHVYYLPREPVRIFQNIDALTAILRGLQGAWAEALPTARVDRLPLSQGFRMPGSLSKAGDPIRAYSPSSGDPIRYGLDELCDWLGIAGAGCDAALTAAGEGGGTKAGNGRAGFYRHCLERCFSEVSEGHREMSLFALAVIGLKCGIPRAEVERDATALFEAFRRRPGAAMEGYELAKALKDGYDARFLYTRSEVLEGWLGFKFRRSWTQAPTPGSGGGPPEGTDHKGGRRVTGALSANQREAAKRVSDLRDGRRLSWAQVADVMGYSERHCRRLYDRGVNTQ